MDFIDEVFFKVQGGRGGNGCVSFRREKFVPKGGPDGGDGGHGGYIILKVNQQLNTLFHLRKKKLYKAGNGQHGKGKKMHGKRGQHVEIPVPPGTLVFNTEENRCLGDLKSVQESLVVATGGSGGKGNTRFATSTRQAPDFSEEGKSGEIRSLRLELKLLADVGLVGQPNAGKSTLLAAVSAARPKIADYPFTTLSPNLGIVMLGDYQQCIMADIPGLIEGAHSGKGLGDRFLRHIERTRLLIFMIDSTTNEFKSTYDLLCHELRQFDKTLLEKPRIIALTKIDALNHEEKKKLPRHLDDHLCVHLSSISGEGIRSLKREIIHQLEMMEHD